MGTKTDKLVEQLPDTHKRLRDNSSRSGMRAQDRTLLERQIGRLEGSVEDLTAHLCEKGVLDVKKDNMFTMTIKKDNMFTMTAVIRTLERVRRHLQEVGANKTQTLHKNS